MKRTPSPLLIIGLLSIAAIAVVGQQVTPPSGGGGSATWGSITGTLSSQTDLQTALNAKQASITGAPGSWPSTFTPSAHASTHQNGGSDEVATATPGANAIPKAGSGGTLAVGWIPTGTSANSVVKLDSSAKLPAVDGSQLTNLPSSGGAMVLVTQLTASNSADLEFVGANACISSTYDDYVLKFVSLIPATANQDLLVQMSTDGSTFDTGNNYVYNLSQSGTGGNFNSNSTAGNGLRAAHDVNNTANWSLSGEAELFAPAASLFKNFRMHTETRSSDGNYYSNVGGGYYQSTTAVVGFRVVFASGNISSGTVRCYGITH